MKSAPLPASLLLLLLGSFCFTAPLESAEVKRGESRSLFYYLSVHASATQWLEIDGVRYSHLRACNMTPGEDSYLRAIKEAKLVIFFTDGNQGANGPAIMNIASLEDGRLLTISDKGTTAQVALYSPSVHLVWEDKIIKFRSEANGRTFDYVIDLDLKRTKCTRTIDGVTDVLFSEQGKWNEK